MALPAGFFTRGRRIFEPVLKPFWRLRPLPRTLPGVLVLSTGDSKIHIGRFMQAAIGSGGWTLSIVRTLAAESANPRFSRPTVKLSPDERQFVARDIETVSDAIDFRISLYDAMTGAVLFSATDNSRPDVIFRGEDPSAPPAVLAEQRLLDKLWEQDRLDNPELPRPIVTGVYSERGDREPQLGSPGWLPTGELIITGACQVAVPPSASAQGDPYPWWGIVGPTTGGEWRFTSKTVGQLPATVRVLAAPAPARDVRRGAPVGDGFELVIDGVVQTASVLASGVVSFDGPFTS